MKTFAFCLGILMGCACPSNPDVVTLNEGWWHVTLSDGRQCIARPYMAPDRDTADEALAECRGVM